MKWVSLAFFLFAILSLPVWPYGRNWTFYPSIFCGFVAVLTLVVSVIGKRGSAVWKHRGQG